MWGMVQSEGRDPPVRSDQPLLKWNPGSAGHWLILSVQIGQIEGEFSQVVMNKVCTILPSVHWLLWVTFASPQLLLIQFNPLSRIAGPKRSKRCRSMLGFLDQYEEGETNPGRLVGPLKYTFTQPVVRQTAMAFASW